jgi:ligand-binding SRPBCC domain-containing protein
MPTHRFESVTRLPLPVAEVFPFFSDISNLDRITPPELGFRTLTPSPIEMREGALIDHEIRLFGFPMKWRTRIALWNPPVEFVDEQLSGPYAEWVHRHGFQDDGHGGTVMTDAVRYRLPFSPFGEVALPFVRLQIGRIFRHREQAIARLLLTQPSLSPPSPPA